MNMDWLKDPTGDEVGSEEKSLLAETDPSGWLLKQIEEDEDHCFVHAGTDHYTAVAQRKTVIVQVDIKLDDAGFVSVATNAGIYASEATEIPFRVFQMSENAIFKIMGYMPAKAGELVTFNVCIRPNEDLDLSKLIDYCIRAAANQAPAFEKIRAGEPASEVCEEIRGEEIRHALRLRQLLG